MKTNTAICDGNGQRKITSTTETLRIKASEIEPGDWLLKPHGRVMRKDALVCHANANHAKTFAYVTVQMGGTLTFLADQMIDVERTR